MGTGLSIELGSQFLRTLILARLLGATEFGLAVSINTLVALTEMISFIGIDRYLVYAADGGHRDTLAIGHALMWARGFLCVVAVLFLAIPASNLVHAHGSWPSFAMVAAAPLLRGASHLGTVQMQRAGRFWPAAAGDAGGAVCGAVAATIAAIALHDHRAVVWGLIVQAGAAALLSHVLSGRIPYRMSLTSSRVRQTLSFGLPLLINGVALAITFQLDRMVVGAWLGVSALGVYGLCTTLFIQPLTLLVRLATTALQPRLSETWHMADSSHFRMLVQQLAYTTGWLGCAGALATACLGAPMLFILFGKSFAATDAFFALMAGVVMMRLARSILNLVGLAAGRTADMMLSNIVGGLALPAMICAFNVYPHMASAPFGALFGELLGYGTIHARLRKSCSTAIDAVTGAVLLATIPLMSVSAWVVLLNPSLPQRVMAVFLGVVAGACWLLKPFLRGEHHRIARQVAD